MTLVIADWSAVELLRLIAQRNLVKNVGKCYAHVNGYQYVGGNDIRQN